MAESLTHALHTYPARMHPATARALVPAVLGDAIARPSKRSLVLLDPFCGSGTTLVEARRAGLCAVGVDANPLAVIIARAKTWTAPAARRDELGRVGRAMAQAALSEGKAARRAGYEAAALRAPRGVDPEERNRRLTHWFAPHVRRELEHLAGAIDALQPHDAELADVLLVVLSSILYKVSRRASDTDPARVERRIGRGAAARLFEERLRQLLAGLDELARAASAPAGQVHEGDARHLARLGIQPASVAGILTSPPYAGTYDYAEQHALRLDFLGLQGAAFERAELGSRRQFAGDGHDRRRARRRFVRALSSALVEMQRVLAPGAMAAIALGDSVAGDRAMWADEALGAALGDAGLEVRAWAWQERPALGAREREAFGDRPKRECIFLLGQAPRP